MRHLARLCFGTALITLTLTLGCSHSRHHADGGCGCTASNWGNYGFGTAAPSQVAQSQPGARPVVASSTTGSSSVTAPQVDRLRPTVAQAAPDKPLPAKPPVVEDRDSTLKPAGFAPLPDGSKEDPLR
jgi:hypothetical protein